MKKIFIINPASCRKKLSYFVSEIKKAFADCEIVLSEKAGDIVKKAKEYKDSILFSVGGDGSFFELVNGAAETSNAVCAVPCGSGNDFVRSVEGAENSFEGTVKNIPEMKERLYDLGKCDEKYFANIGSVGYDAAVVRNSAKFRKIPVLRKISYIMGIFTTLVTYRGTELDIDLDGKNYKGKYFLIAVANGKYYGGGVKIAPEADMRDGFFDVLLVDNISPVKFLVFFPRLLNGTHTGLECVHLVRTKSVTVKSGDGNDFDLNLDGELFPKKSADFNLIENGLRYYAK